MHNASSSSYQLICLSVLLKIVNPFHATRLFLYPLKTSEIQRFADVFRGYTIKPWHEMDSRVLPVNYFRQKAPYIFQKVFNTSLSKS